MTAKNIFDKIEKIDDLAAEDILPKEEDEEEKDPGLLIIISYEGNEQEIVFLEKESAIKAVEYIFEKLKGPLPAPVTLQDYKAPSICSIDPDKLSDFKSVVLLTEGVRSVRIVDPEEFKDLQKD